jgi:hypothetical protein
MSDANLARPAVLVLLPGTQTAPVVVIHDLAAISDQPFHRPADAVTTRRIASIVHILPGEPVMGVIVFLTRLTDTSIIRRPGGFFAVSTC